MPGRLNQSNCSAAGAAAPARPGSTTPRLCVGIAMVELMVALLVFSIGWLGLASAQLTGKRAGYDALQRSVATALAGDLLERVRANPGHASRYAVEALGADGERLSEPEPNCDTSNCSGVQLAAFDLWQWQRQLLGGDAGATGTLLAPRACIASDAGMVRVVITWLAVSRSGSQLLSSCGTDSQPRHQLGLVTFVGGS
jgi:type IV pilus assembly protein PilV